MKIVTFIWNTYINGRDIFDTFGKKLKIKGFHIVSIVVSISISSFPRIEDFHGSFYPIYFIAFWPLSGNYFRVTSDRDVKSTRNRTGAIVVL